MSLSNDVSRLVNGRARSQERSKTSTRNATTAGSRMQKSRVESGDHASRRGRLASEKAGHVHGEVFRAGNGRVNLFRGWQEVRQVGALGHPLWEPEELGAAMEKEFFSSPPPKRTMEDLMKEMAGR